MLYHQIEQAIREHEPQLSVPNGTTFNDLYQCIRNVTRDNPELFWFSYQWKYLEENHKIHFSYTINREKRLKVKKQIDDVVQNDFRICKVQSLQKTEQVMYVYKWLALYCKYNIYSAYNQTIYSVFVCRNSVCTGYARAAQYLFKLLGIESKLVFGIMHNSEKGSRHCWLVVKINNQWYHFDPTFALPDISYLLSKAGVEPIFGADGLVYNHFCCNTEYVKLSRTIEDERELPICTSTIDYKPLQNLPIQIHRNEGADSQGVKGCILSDTGSYADVYLWHWEKTTQSVVKIFKKDAVHNLLNHELRMMHELSSSSFVLHFLGLTENQDGIIIEQATPLADLLRSPYYQLSAINFCKLILDVVTGLKDCLEHGIYYRDIHLNNIFLNNGNQYVLGDFGSCVFINEEYPSNFGGVGSPWYVAPETYQYNIFNEASTTYEIGMLAFFLLNDLYPPLYRECGKEESLKRRITGSDLPAPILLMKPTCAFEQQLAFIIQKSLSFEPDRRYQTLSDLEKSLKQCISLAEGKDYLLIDCSSGERTIEFEEKDNGNNNCNIHPEFYSTCEVFPTILVSNGENEKNNYRHDRINDFATTARGLFREKDNIPSTFQPSFKTENTPKKESIWKKLFGKKKKTKEYDVCSSVFAPAEVMPNSYLMTQVFLHLLEEAETISQLAVESDKNAKRRDYMPLWTKLKMGDEVDVELIIRGDTLLFKDKKKLRWQGRFTRCKFEYLIPQDTDMCELNCEVNLYVNRFLIGEMSFITDIVDYPRKLYSKVNTRLFKRIFISYAHKDSAFARILAYAYKAQGVDYFFDRDKLMAGDIYNEKILEFIDSSDLFILLWSENAANSDYVAKEYKRALLHAYPQISRDEATLKIHPMSIVPRTKYPQELAEIYNFEEV